MDHMCLRFTMDRRHGRPWELTGARPPATPGLKVIGEGAGEVEEAAVSTFVGSSELGRWGNGGAAESDDWRRCSVGVHSDAGEEERRAGEVQDSSRSLGWLL
jgi:hypothetical protein